MGKQGLMVNAGFTFYAIAFFLSSCVPAGAWSASAIPLDVKAIPIELDPKNPDRERFDGLTLLSGFELSSKDSRFGGLSGLELSDDGTLLYAVSDRGYWFSARLHHDTQGRLTGLAPWEMAPLRTPAGSVVSRRLRDAEALVRDRDGSFIVAFEGTHRLWRYPRPLTALASPPRPIPVPAELQEAPANGGLEAVTILPDQRLLLLTEKHENRDGSLKGWLIENGQSASLSYLYSDGFRPTDLATLASGDVLILEHRHSWISGTAARIRRLSHESLKVGALLKGEIIADLGPDLTLDNFEGLAVREDPEAGTLLYMISDDNYSSLQRTLLFQFRLLAPAP